MWGPGTWEIWQTRYIGISFSWQMVSFHITRTLLHSQLSHQAHQEQMTIQHSPIATQTHHQSLHHARQQSDASTGRMRQGHPRNDRQSQELSSHIGLTKYCWRNTCSCTNKSPPIWRNHYPRPFLQHATSSESAGTSKHSHTPYQWQQTNHGLHATAGTNSKGAHRYS